MAFEILERVESAGAFASVLLERRSSRLADGREAGLARELVLGVLRQQAALDHAIGLVAGRDLRTIEAPVRVALRIGAYQILFLDRVPAFAAVDSTVALVKAGGRRRAAGFVNAVLRGIARQGGRLLPPEPAEGDVAAAALRHSHPVWWVERLVARLGWAEALALLAADNRPAPTVIRVNGRACDVDRLSAELGAEGLATERCGLVPEALRVRGAAQTTRAFAEGRFWIQDEASQLVPLLFGAGAVAVADVCAAPGGKSMVLSDRFPQARRVACDRHPGRAAAMKRSLARAGMNDVAVVVADLAACAPPFAPGSFDRVLVDAPCTGTGTLRRHPEIRWRLRASDPSRLAEVQLAILRSASTLVAPGGQLVYSVCSLEPEEGAGVVEAFLGAERSFSTADASANLPAAARALIDRDGFLTTSPADGGLDGFVASLLVRH